MKPASIVTLALAAAAAGIAPAASAAAFDEVFVFGDSLSDAGNAWALTGGFPPSPPYAGRFSNGPTAAEQLAAAYGIDLQPSVQGGSNYAVGGAALQTYTVPYAPNPGLTPPAPLLATSNYIAYNYWPLEDQYQIAAMADKGIGWQVDQFRAADPVFEPQRSLFMLWGGANDFFLLPALAALAPPDQQQAVLTGAVAGAAAQAGAFVAALYDAGARNFLVPNLPDLARTPDSAELSDAQRAQLSQLSLLFNVLLADQIEALRTARTDLRIVEVDVRAGFDAILADPAQFGLTNATDACLPLLITGGSCDPATFLFWDGVHPTVRGSQIIASVFFDRLQASVVREPALSALMCMVLLAFGWFAEPRLRVTTSQLRPERG
jgi:phospholipase/lecithinase/hemolysin